MTGKELLNAEQLRYLQRLVRGEPVPLERDQELDSDLAQHLAKTFRAADNGHQPADVIDQALREWPAADADAIARALLDDSEIHSAGPIENEVSTETNFEWRTAREIAETTPARPEWIAHGLVAKGAITEVDAKIKAGKTEFVARLIKAILSGDDFLERATRQTRVVYLTEQTPATFREPLRRAGLLETDDLVVLSWADTIGHRWEIVAAAAVAKCAEIGAQLLVVDTLGAFARIKDEGENSSGAAAEAMAPLQVAAANGLAIIVLRHDRKSGGDVGESARGSSAFGGAADIILALRRGEGNSRPTIRALHGLSRFDETPQTLMIELTAAGYVALGTEGAVAAKEARIAILDAAPQSEEHAVTEQDLYERAGAVKRSTARPALVELVANGALEVVGEGKKGDPRRYWRRTGPQIHRVETPVVTTESFLTASPTVGGPDAPVAQGILSAGTSHLIATEFPAAFPAESARPGEGLSW